MYVFSECGCYDLQIKLDEAHDYIMCQSLSQIRCISSAFEKFYSVSQAKFCYKECPLECTKVFYPIKLSMAAYPSKWYSRILLNNTKFVQMINKSIGYNEMRAKLLMVNIYYDDLQFTVTKELPKMSIDLFLALIGGNFGLFLGASFLCFIEIFEIIFYSIYFLLSYLLTLKNKHKQINE